MTDTHPPSPPPDPHATPIPWLGLMSSRFIVFDGPDGSGKTTQYKRFVAAVRAAGVDVCEVREPGGTGIGEEVRTILLDHAHHDMTLTCEMLLYMASRAQLVEQRIRPALEAGAAVIADRFVSSTLVYQGHAGGLPVESIQAAADIALAGVEPDLVVIFDVDGATAAGRLSPLLDRMEAKGAAFHTRVRQGYLKLASEQPTKYLVIDASGPEDDVWASLLASLHARFSPGTPPESDA